MIVKGGYALINEFAVVDLGLFSSAKSIQSPPSKDEDHDTSQDFILWGTNDNYPNDVIKDAEKDTVILPGIRFKSDMHFGGGVGAGIIDVDANGKEIFRYERDPAFIQFKRANKLNQEVYLGLYDLNYFSTSVVLMALSEDRQKIVRYTHRLSRSSNIRLGRRDSYGNIKSVFVNPDFGTSEYQLANNKEYLVAPEFGAADWVAEKRPKVFAVVMQVADSGRMYYPMPDWHTARNSEWMKISSAIAVFKKHLMQNQFSLKYHIKVHPQFWPQYFGAETWEGYSDAEKQANASEWLESLEEFFKGTEAAGNNLMTSMGEYLNNQGGSTFDMVEIEDISNRFSKDGTYIEDSKEASEHKISALGLHPDIVGSSPGSRIGSGSGSGNRVAFNQRVSMSRPIQDIVLSPLEIVRDFNGWNPELEFRIRESLITTLDTGAAATKPEEQP